MFKCKNLFKWTINIIWCPESYSMTSFSFILFRNTHGYFLRFAFFPLFKKHYGATLTLQNYIKNGIEYVTYADDNQCLNQLFLYLVAYMPTSLATLTERSYFSQNRLAMANFESL